MRSSFDFHGRNKYYDNHVTKNGYKVSHRQYLYAYDLFEVLAVNLLIKMKSGINIFPKSLEELEKDEENIYPARIVELKYWSLSNVTLMNFIYQYKVVDGKLTSQDFQNIKKHYMINANETSTGHRLKAFYTYFTKFDENIQKKVEHYIINPFLTEEKYKKYRDEMFAKYIRMDKNKLYSYNIFLPQPRNQLTNRIYEEYKNLRDRRQGYHGAEYKGDQSHSGHGGSGDNLGGSYGAGHEGYQRHGGDYYYTGFQGGPGWNYGN
uniref:Uncharacterized protein n=1 Tax=Meloidogyne javanica TaxID=6303 RepID=A0A915N0A9_MELJA